jgi:LCP family protein required for cell wall assembly
MNRLMSTPSSMVRVFLGRYAIAFGVAAVFMIGSVLTVNYVIDAKLNNVSRVKVKTAPAPAQGANFLLIGSDTRAFVKNSTQRQAFGDPNQESGQRSDTIMVVHVLPGARKTLVVSFPRDLWVKIPGVGMSKINAAYNISPTKVIDTLRDNFGVQINHYMEVDFQTFRGVVNAIGSVPVYFPYPARDLNTGLNQPPGCRRLDGAAALGYVRSRDLEYFSSTTKAWVPADLTPDIDRIHRQQDFMRKLAGLAVQKSLNDPLAANSIVDHVLNNLKIDQGLSKDDIFSLVDAFRTVNPNNTGTLDMETLPWQEGPAQGGQSVLYPKDPDWRAMVGSLSDFSGNSSPVAAKPAQVALRVLNGTGRSGVAQGTLDQLAKLGFKRAGAGTDPRGTVALTEVQYRPGQIAKGELLLEYLDPQARFVEDSSLSGADVELIVGTDFRAVIKPSSQSAASAPTTTTTAPAASSTPSGGLTPAPIDNQSRLGAPAPKVAPC